MAKPRPAPVPGSHPIDSGTAEVVADPISGGWLLLINGTHSSHIHPDDPSALDFEYLRQMAAVIEDRYPDTSTPLRVLHLGGAACALPRNLADRYPRARQVAVEIDAELARLVREWFDLPRTAVTYSRRRCADGDRVADRGVAGRGDPRCLRRRTYAVASDDSRVRTGGQTSVCLLYTSPSPRDRG